MNNDNEQNIQGNEPVMTEEQARLQGEQMAREAIEQARKETLKSMPGMMAESMAKQKAEEVISHMLPDEVNRIRWAGWARNIPIVSDIVQWMDNIAWLRRLFLILALIVPMMVQGVSIQTIKMGWKSKVITNVPTAGLGVMLERFDQTWPTSVGADVCQVMMTGAEEMVLDRNTGYKVINDAKNGYVETSDMGSDRQRMQACVWRRSNGHRLFAVVLSQPVNPEIEIICFYDYDPQRKMLTPEPKAIGEWMDITEKGDYSFTLPRVGKELLIFDSNDQLMHHFKWNGMRPVYDRSEQMADVQASNFPGGLADDGRGPEETEPYGVTVKYDGDEYVRVSTAEQFVNALRSDAMILVAKDTEINLTPLLDDPTQFRTRYRQWRPYASTDVGNQQVLISEEVFDGRQLTICNHKQMMIRGEGHSSIVVAPRYAFCLNFKDCEQIEIRDLTIGHTKGGYCEGGVIGVSGGWRIMIQNCDLYGCGTYGLDLSNTRDFSMYRSNIHDCTYGIMMLNKVETAKFDMCDFYHNREFALVESHSSYPIFNDCRFYDNEPTAPLFSCDGEFYLSGCTICHPAEQLGTMHLADQSGAKNWYDSNPKNESMKPRGIGPK